MADLTLPGDIPGLLRRGSPVLERGAPAIYGGPDHRSRGQTHRVWLTMQSVQGSVPLSLLALDLTDATARAHAAWWLADRLDRMPYHGLPTLCLWPGLWSLAWQDIDRDRLHEVALSSQDDGCEDFHGAIRVPALANLDLEDTRTLPDGSRWVDAEALRLVCLHVAGRGDRNSKEAPND